MTDHKELIDRARMHAVEIATEARSIKDAGLIDKLCAALEDAERELVQGRYALDNSRCPECGCATPDEAVAAECGCDSAVCSIEAPETLGEAHVRVSRELAEAREEIARMRRELAGAHEIDGEDLGQLAEEKPWVIKEDPTND